MKSEHFHNWNFYENFIITAYNSAIMQFNKFFILLICYSAIFFISDKSKKFSILLVILFVADIYSFNQKFFEVKSIKEIKDDMTFYDNIQLNTDNYRVLPLVPLDHFFALNGPMFYQIKSVRGYDPLVDNDFIYYMRNIETNLSDVHPNTEISKPDLNSQLINLLNIKYIVSDLPLNISEKIIYLKKYKDLYIYENKKNIGYAKIFSNIIFEPDLIKSYNMIKNNKIDCSDILIINGSSDNNANKNNYIENFKNIFQINNNKSVINNIVSTDNLIHITGYSDSSAYLFISEKFSNFHKILYNNVPVNKIRSNYLFLSVKLNKGNFDIKLLKNEKTYFFVTLVTFSILLFLVILIFFLKNKKYLDFFNIITYILK